MAARPWNSGSNPWGTGTVRERRPLGSSMRSVAAVASRSAQRTRQASETRKPHPARSATSSRSRGLGSASNSRRNSRACNVSGSGHLRRGVTMRAVTSMLPSRSKQLRSTAMTLAIQDQETFCSARDER